MGSFFDALSIYRGGPHNDIKLNRRSHNENGFGDRNELVQTEVLAALRINLKRRDKHIDFKLGQLGEW